MSLAYHISRFVATGFLICLGAVAFTFGYYVGPAAWQQRSLERISKRIIAQEAFNTDSVQAALSQFDGQADGEAAECWPSHLRAATLLKLRLLEVAIGRGDRIGLDQKFGSLRASVVRALGCAPADSFLWFALYWVEVSQNGLSAASLKYLDASYRYGKFEGWIQVKRNRYALAIFERLPPDLADTVVREFVTMVNSGFVDAAAANLAGPGSPIRDRLLASLGDTKMRFRRELLKELRRRGIDAPIPDVQIEARPWN